MIKLTSFTLLATLSFAAPLLSGCVVSAETDDLEDVDTVSSALTGEAVYEVANVYNTGVAVGHMVSFASIAPSSKWATLEPDLASSFQHVKTFWPGGPVAGGALGAAITYDGQPLPIFSEIQPPYSSQAYSAAQAINNKLDAILINRTPYAPYYSLGALMAMAKIQAAYSHNKTTDMFASWNLSVAMLDDAIDLANALCRPSPNVWKTAFNVQEMRDLRASLPPGPNYANWPGIPSQYFYKPALYLHDRLHTIIGNLGSTISNPSTLETGVHGMGCY